MKSQYEIILFVAVEKLLLGYVLPDERRSNIMNFLSSKEICREYKLTMYCLNKACKEGKLVPDRVVPLCNKRLFTKETIEAWLDKMKK